MSLLLEALKKAEKAKEEAQRRARGESGEPAAPAARPAPPPAAQPQPAAQLALEGEDTPAPAEETKRVMTRAELPNITSSMEIDSNDIAAPKAARPREELRLEGSKEPARRTAAPQAGTKSTGQAAASAPAASPQAAERDAGRNTARKVFEAKFKEPNPKLPFYITMGVLGACAVGVVIYFWWQLRPPYPLVNSNPPRPSAETQVAAAQERPAPPAAAPSAPGAAVIPGLPGGPPPQPAARAPAPAPIAPPVERPLLSPAPRLAAPSVNTPPAAAPARPLPEVNVSRSTPQIHPKVQTGYAAYQAGDLAKARGEYEQALTDEPGNRDALLGLAALDTRTGRYESAEANYLRLLQVDPRDAHAQAGLLALRSARLDPLVSESRVKSMLAQDPGSHVLNFALGNQLAQQGRWSEAQQEYFKAFAGDPENADFAYNLAISLDHLRQRRPAREYYLRAIALAEKRGASFDLAGARARAEQLGN